MYLFNIFHSFVPLRNPLGFGVSDLIELGLTLLALLAIFGYAWMGSWLMNFARRTAWCMLVLFILPAALRLALLPRVPPPVATTSPEFSSLLASDTLLHGRLGNPPHRFHEFFETPLVVQTPVYRSTLPIGDGLLPAAGQLLFHSDWAGILLGAGVLAALSYWMLRVWITPGWALFGGVLVACFFGPLCRWTNSYWGGFIAALAGCLILGALPRLKQNPRRAAFSLNLALLGLGLAIELLAHPSAFCLFVPIVILAAILCLKRLKQFRPALLFVILLMGSAHFLFWYGMHALGEASLNAVRPYGGRDFLNSAEERSHRAVAEELNNEPGKQVVFVRRSPWSTAEERASGQWIHNSADIDASKTVWARDLGEDKNRKLLDYYRSRKAWLWEPDAIPPRLRPYAVSTAPPENVQ
ncbi:MAG TPA: hypothetical protein VHU83_17955 [Bryobacteraceae bacterium]|jgi:hypothetical protein|nr:hypothetical protein [Bryobacteraceae bacterium]